MMQPQGAVAAPVRLEIGRFGYRGLKGIASGVKSSVQIDCRTLRDPVLVKEGSRVVAKRELSLQQICDELKRDQRDATEAMVKRVVEGIVDGKTVCVRCMKGQHRSQAIAALACSDLAELHPEIVFEGPIFLGGISPTL